MLSSGRKEGSRFPWKKDYISEEEICRRFSNLSHFHCDLVSKAYIIKNMPNIIDEYLNFNYSTYSGRALMIHSKNDYKELNEISDYWIEEIRASARRLGNPSLLELWNKNSKKYLGTLEEKREGLYRDARVEVGTFRPSCGVKIIKLFKSKRILDFCSGWGDRLIASLACNVDKYTGVDPNTKLALEYEKIILFFKERFDIKTDVEMICSPFQNAIIKDKYDLILTSPPYFELEIYSEKKLKVHQEILV